MTNKKVLVSLVLLAGMLAGCGTTGAPTAVNKQATALQALKKTDKTGPKADASRPTPPAGADKSTQPKQGFAAREAARVSDRALSRYSSLCRDWENAWSDAQKDRIEQDMLNVLNQAMKDVQDVTSSSGHDSADRRAYDIADAGLDRYEYLFRQWQAAWSDREKRQIVNDMLTGMVRTLKDVQNNY